MNSRDTATRYLLGEMPEDERTAFEEAYFGDPRDFTEVADVEHALIDDYVRGQLSPEVRARVEWVYLSDPRRRERLVFAEALAERVDAAAIPSPSGWRNWFHALTRTTPAARWAFASAIVVAIVSGVVWLQLDSTRSRQEDSRAAAPAPVAPAPDAPLAPSAPVAPVVLALTVGPGVRGAETRAPATLVVPSGTAEVRFELSLQERDYASYRVVLRAVGGAEILRRGDLEPSADRSEAAFTIALPANRFNAGDYMLTLQGATSGGEFEDLSQTLFRVERPAR